jgi:hypothetical protein
VNGKRRNQLIAISTSSALKANSPASSASLAHRPLEIRLDLLVQDHQDHR